MRALLAILLLTSAGCTLPLVSGAPQSARTVGKGHFGITGWAEVPSINLAAAPGGQAIQPDDAVSPAVSGLTQVAVGLTDGFDLGGVGYSSFGGEAFDRQQTLGAFTAAASGVALFTRWGVFRPSLAL